MIAPEFRVVNTQASLPQTSSSMPYTASSYTRGCTMSCESVGPSRKASIVSDQPRAAVVPVRRDLERCEEEGAPLVDRDD